MTKTIISCAVTGAIHTPSMSPYLPVTPEQIIADAIAASEAGAAIIHLHARNPIDGRPDQSPQAFAPLLSALKASTNAVINITTGGSPSMLVAERIKPALEFAPELASLNMGSMNFGLFPMLKRFKEFNHDWERDHLTNSKDLVFRNTFADIEYIISELGSRDTRFEFECYDTGHLYNLAHFVDRGIVKPPFFIQSIFGLLGGIGNHDDDVRHMKITADRLFGSSYVWSVLGAGSSQVRIGAQSLLRGGHVRVGLEDSLWVGKGQLAQSSAEQVRRMKSVIESLGQEPATPDDARNLLGLKGLARVGF